MYYVMRYGPMLANVATKMRVTVWYRTRMAEWALTTAQRERERDLTDPTRSRGVYWIAKYGQPAHRRELGDVDARP